MMPSQVKTRTDRVLDALEVRACFICSRTGRCKHREYEVEMALVDAELRRAQRRPPQSVTASAAVGRQPA